MSSNAHRTGIAVARVSTSIATEPLQSAADARGHGPQTAGSGVGAMLGGMIGSFAGPLGAFVGAGVGAAIGYRLCE